MLTLTANPGGMKLDSLMLICLRVVTLNHFDIICSVNELCFISDSLNDVHSLKCGTQSS